MREKIMNYIRAGYPGLFVVSHEEARLEAELQGLAQQLKYGLYAWSVTEGLVNTKDGKRQEAGEPLEVINQIQALGENVLVLLRDLHTFLADANPILVRAIKDALRVAKTKGRVLLIVGCRQVLPPELEREFVVLDFALPDKAALGTVLDGILKSAKLKKPEADERALLLDAASGLTTTEAENAFALSVVEAGRIQPGLVAREKAQSVKKNGLLEICEVRETLADIGGLDVLKDWLLKRREAFSERAVSYGLPAPKGLLILGVAGTGKSLTARATASVLQRPLLKLDVSRIFGSLVGQSEQNLRAVLQTAESIAPCVLLVEELEKGFAGSRSSGASDGGTTSRVFGSFLDWLQQRSAPVFVVATANDVSQLPPELLRRGRWDELMFVDLPNTAEREAIWRIQIGKHKRDAGKFDVGALARASEGLTGAEIEQAFVDALYAAFAEHKEPTTLTCSMVLGELVPLSQLMGEQIKALREWSRGRARLATSRPVESTERRIAA